MRLRLTRRGGEAECALAALAAPSHQAAMPVSPAYQPDPQFPTLGGEFADPVKAADFPATILRFRNDRAAETVGLDTLADAEWIAHFGRFEPLPGNLPEPLALRYHGHQFRSYNPERSEE